MTRSASVESSPPEIPITADFQEVHSQVTLEMETGRDIPLTEWAFKNGIDASYARAKARRGGYLTAKKIGRDWFISELEENKDKRRK